MINSPKNIFLAAKQGKIKKLLTKLVFGNIIIKKLRPQLILDSFYLIFKLFRGFIMATFMKNINMIAQSGALFREEKLQDEGICGWHTKYILAVCGAEGVSQEVLAKQLFVNKSNVARQIAALEEKGYVKRVQSPKDRRAFNVYSTEKGKQLYLKIKEINAEWRNLITENFTEEEREQLWRLTDKLYANAKEIMERGQ